MKFRTWLSRVWDRFLDRKVYRVLYNEGGFTRELIYMEAESLSRIFGGTVIHTNDLDREAEEKRWVKRNEELRSAPPRSEESP